MGRTLRLAALLLVAVALVGCRSVRRPAVTPSRAEPSRPAEPAHPATVTALRYRTWISIDPPRRPDAGYWIEELWFPEWQLEANVEPESWGEPPRLNVYRAEFPHANTKAGAASIPTGGDPREPYQGPTERVEVPWDLAQRIKAASDFRTRYEDEQKRVGPDLAATGLLRKVNEGDARQ